MTKVIIGIKPNWMEINRKESAEHIANFLKRKFPKISIIAGFPVERTPKGFLEKFYFGNPNLKHCLKAYKKRQALYIYAVGRGTSYEEMTRIKKEIRDELYEKHGEQKTLAENFIHVSDSEEAFEQEIKTLILHKRNQDRP